MSWWIWWCNILAVAMYSDKPAVQFIVWSWYCHWLLTVLKPRLFLLPSDPRERLKEDDLDVVLSPQRRSFGGGCQGNAALAPHTRRPISPLENKENESLRLGGARRIGSGRIIAARAFEREPRVEKERERERDFKDKRFRVGGCCLISPSLSIKCWVTHSMH